MRIIGRRIVTLMVGLAVLSAGSALAGPIGASVGGAGVQVVVDGQVFDFEADRDGRIVVEDFRVVLEQELLAEFSIDALLDPDPSIAYVIGVTDFGAPSVFGFLFGTPIVPVGPTSVVEASLSAELTDSRGDGVTITPTAATVQSSQAGLPLISMGVDVGPGYASGPGAPGAVYSYGPYLVPPQPGPAGNFTFLTVSNGFGLSGDGDKADFIGYTSINNTSVPVPEPAGLSLLAIGLGGAMRAGRRRT